MRGLPLMYCFLFSLLALGSCTDNAISDKSYDIPGRNWSYVYKIKAPVKIDDPTKNYAVFLNLRHTADYKYSNIFVLVRLTGPGIVAVTERKEFRLAYPDGEWLGSGSGNLFSYQLPLLPAFRFPAKGTYTFEIEQNMRDNPLREIGDVGIRVEPGQ